MKIHRDILKCECGNEDQTKIVTASNGEVICLKCGAVLGRVVQESKEHQEQNDGRIGEADNCRKILEDCVSKKE